MKIIFKSPTQVGLDLLKKNGYPLPASNDQSENGEMGEKKVSIFTRKAGYHYGWDWGPRLVTSGIWRPIKLIAYNQARIEQVHFIQNELSDNIARLKADVELSSISNQKIKMIVEANGKVLNKIEIDKKEGISNHQINFEINNRSVVSRSSTTAGSISS